MGDAMLGADLARRPLGDGLGTEDHVLSLPPAGPAAAGADRPHGGTGRGARTGTVAVDILERPRAQAPEAPPQPLAMPGRSPFYRPQRPSLLRLSTLPNEVYDAVQAERGQSTEPAPVETPARRNPLAQTTPSDLLVTGHLSQPRPLSAAHENVSGNGFEADEQTSPAVGTFPRLADSLPPLADRRRAMHLQRAAAANALRRPPMGMRQDTTPDLLQRAGLVAAGLHAHAPVQTDLSEGRGKLFAHYTRYKPFYLLAMGAAGNWLYGTGTVAMERGIYPRRPVAPPGSPNNSLPPVFQPLFGSMVDSLAIGSCSTAAGALLALASSGMFYKDARALSRRVNPQNPSYTRANAYFVAHLIGIALSLGAKFATEALRDLFSRDTVWAALVPGQVGQALFAVTQAQAFSSSELYNGKMRLRHRSEIGFAARFLVGLYSLYGVLQGVPYLSSYGKEVVRLSAVTAATLAYALPLTTARIERIAPNLPASVRYGERPKDSWHALNLLGVFFVGRILAGFGPDLIQQGVQTGIETDRFGSIAGPVFSGASMLALGTAACATAIMLFRQDVAAYDLRKANFWAGLAIFGLLLVETYRGIFELGLVRADRRLAFVSAVPGVFGTGLRLAVMPEMFCYSELLRGTLPLKHRYQWTESCRGAAQMLFGIWGSTCALPGFNPFIRESIGVSAGILATLGMALPTTTSRETLPQYAWPLSPGATPAIGAPGAENRDPFSLLNLDALVPSVRTPDGTGPRPRRGP